MFLFFNFLSEYIWVYVWLFFTTFINIIAPLPGSVVVNPVTAFFTDPQRAIGIGAFSFFLSGLHRAYLFRKETFQDKGNLKILKKFLPYTIVGAVGGGFLITYLNVKVLAGMIVIVALYYIQKTLRQIFTDQEIKKNAGKHSYIGIAAFSGFLQGAGMPGSDIRNNYLRSILSEVSTRGVTSFIGLVNFFIAGSIIFFHNQLALQDIIFIVTAAPFLVLLQMYGKTHLERMSDKKAKLLSIAMSLIGIVLLSYKYLI
jgi:uncharacterized membrane protein YfcA